MFFYLSLELSWCRVSFLKGDLQFSKFSKNTICLGLCKLKCTEKCFIPVSPLNFLPEFVPHTEFKGRPEDTKWNVLYHTALRKLCGYQPSSPLYSINPLSIPPTCLGYNLVFYPPSLTSGETLCVKKLSSLCRIMYR